MLYAQVAACGRRRRLRGRGTMHRRDQSWAAAPVGSWQLKSAVGFQCAGLDGAGLVETRVWRSRSGSCLPVRHFVSFLCFADKCSRAYAANPLPRHAPAHICIELYLLLVAVVPPSPCSQRILVAKLSHLRQQCRRGCRCNWSRSWSRSRFRRHLCAALACIFLPFEFVKSTSINLSSVRCFGSDSGSGSVALARHLHLRRLVLHARFHFGAAQIFR